MRGRWDKLRQVVTGLAIEFYALYLALRDPRAGWPARIVALLFALYVINPVDVIPEPVPILGIVDDVLVLLLGYALVARLLPQRLVEGALRKASATPNIGERLWRAIVVVFGILAVVWLAALAGLAVTIGRSL